MTQRVLILSCQESVKKVFTNISFHRVLSEKAPTTSAVHFGGPYQPCSVSHASQVQAGPVFTQKTFPCAWLVAWSSGITSVYGR